MFRAAVGKFVMDVGTVDTLQQAWRRLPPTIQQRAMVIAQKQGSWNGSEGWLGRCRKS